jgi:hypothetical protein
MRKILGKIVQSKNITLNFFFNEVFHFTFLIFLCVPRSISEYVCDAFQLNIIFNLPQMNFLSFPDLSVPKKINQLMQ